MTWSIRNEIAPTATLRVGLMAGAHPSPFLVTLDRCTGQASGVSRVLGQSIADALELPVEFIIHNRLGALDASARRLELDLTFAPITPDREAVLAFSEPYFQFANTLLVPESSRLMRVDEADRMDLRVGALADSVHRQLLVSRLPNASLVTAPSLEQLTELLERGDVDAIAHAKPILSTMERRMRGVRLLEGAFSTTSLAAAVPKGRPAAWHYVCSFVAAAARNGMVGRVFSQAGLRSDGSA